MTCPHCGANAGTAKFCPYCDSELRRDDSNDNKKLPHPRIPTGYYAGLGGDYIQLSENWVHVHHFVWRTYDIRIPYNLLLGVYYYPPYSINPGHLIFRWEGNRYVPLPKPSRAPAEPTAFPFMKYEAQRYYELYQTLLALIPAEARANYNVVSPYFR